MSYSKNTIAAGATWDLVESAGFFRLMATTGAVKVGFYKNGSLLSEVENVQAGFWRKGEIDRVRITNQLAAANAVEIMQDLSDVGYDRSVGTVALNDQGRPFTQLVAAIGTSEAPVVAQNSNRRFLSVQNKDAAAIIYLRFDGAAATVANGFKVDPGATVFFDAIVPTGEIRAIGSAAASAVVMEG